MRCVFYPKTVLVHQSATNHRSNQNKNFYHAMPPKTNRRKGGHPKKPIASISPNQEPMLQRPLRVPGVLCRLTSPSVVPERGVSPTNCPPRQMIRTSHRGIVASEGQELTSSDKTERMRPLRVTSGRSRTPSVTPLWILKTLTTDV